MDKWKKTIMHMGAYPAALGKWVLLGGIIGVAGGVIGSLFHIGVNYATAIRGAHPWILYLLPVGGLAIVGLYKLCHLEGKGTNAIIESVHFGESVPILLVPVIFVSTVITHLCGGSAGREGAALQIGGGLGYEAGKLLHLGEKDLPLATLCGMSGVFSALFGTPLTATVFALEVISVGVLYYAGLVPCITAAMAAFGVSTLMGVEPTRFAVAMPPVTLETMVPVVALAILLDSAILCAVVSILFCKGLHWTERLLDRGFRSPWVRVLAGSVLLIGMSLLTNGDYNGAGMDVIARALAGEADEDPVHRRHHRLRLQGRRGGAVVLRGGRLRLLHGGPAGPARRVRRGHRPGGGVLRGGELPGGLGAAERGAVRLRRCAVFCRGLRPELSPLRLLRPVQQPDHPLFQAPCGVHQRPHPRVTKM